MARDPTWDFLDPASKGRLLGVLQREVDEMFGLAAEPARWHTPTACPGWELRDMVGHLVDADGGLPVGVRHRAPRRRRRGGAGRRGRHGQGRRRGRPGVARCTP